MRAQRRLKSRLTRLVPNDGEGLARRIHEGIFAHAFDEDVALQMLPIPRQKRFTISTTPETAESRNFVRDALAWDQGSSHDDLEDVAWHFFRSCAHYLTNYGEVIWELCPSEPEGLALVFVQPETVRRHWFRTAQRSRREDGRRVFTIIPPDRLVRVCTRDTHLLRVTRNHLAGPAFSQAALSSLIGPEHTFPGDLGQLIKTQDLALAQVGRICDWDGRTFFAQRVSEFYYVLRILRFRRRIAVIRDALITGINTALEKGNASIRVAIAGLLSANDFLQLKSDLLAGSKSLKVVRDIVLGSASKR